MHNPRKDSPSFHRNIGPIAEKLGMLLEKRPLEILEIGSGSGQHAKALGALFPTSTFHPSDAEPENLASIDAWNQQEASANVSPARLLDVTNPNHHFMPDTPIDVVLCFNVIHIAPWQVTENLFAFAETVTGKNARLFLYGPFRINGRQTSESNAQFEGWLKSQDPAFGVRAIEDVDAFAQKHGFASAVRHEMPANNYLMEFSRN